MNVSREVITDLLPVYFSGEASTDTRSLVEDYFRGNPDFERVARSAATPLEALRHAARVTPDAEREKRDLECVHRELRRTKVFFGVALFLTLAPLAFFFSKGHFFWLVRENPWEAAISWSIATILWLGYFGRLGRRAASVLFAMILILAPIVLDMHFSFTGGLKLRDKNYFDVLWQAILFWSVAAMLIIQNLARLRRRTALMVFGIFLTVLPLPFMLYAVIAGGPRMAGNVAQPAVLWFFAAWVWVTRYRQRGTTDSDGEC
ncbi:MAG: hypothetical protein WA681_16310 [Candidatus Acidiferrales bacterium]